MTIRSPNISTTEKKSVHRSNNFYSVRFLKSFNYFEFTITFLFKQFPTNRHHRNELEKSSDVDNLVGKKNDLKNSSNKSRVHRRHHSLSKVRRSKDLKILILF
jgi:hypothetical protein